MIDLHTLPADYTVRAATDADLDGVIRLAGLAGPSEILVSLTVKDLVAGSGVVFASAGEHELKGVPDRWRLYRAAG